MDLAGTWHIEHDWKTGDRSGPYEFKAKFGADGTINVLTVVFYGAWQAAGTTGSDVSFAITDFAGQSLTVYSGTVSGNQITGTMSGLMHIGEHVHTGTFTATREA